MTPEDCPKFERCGANICPLDDDWRKRTHLEGEPVCLYLREAAKNGGTPPESPTVTEEQRREVARVYPDVIKAHGPIRRALNRASKTGSKMSRNPSKKNAPVAAGAQQSLEHDDDQGGPTT